MGTNAASQTMADSVMYREALAAAAEARRLVRVLLRSGHLGRLGTNLRQLRRLQPQGTSRRGRLLDDTPLQTDGCRAAAERQRHYTEQIHGKSTITFGGRFRSYSWVRG